MKTEPLVQLTVLETRARSDANDAEQVTHSEQAVKVITNKAGVRDGHLVAGAEEVVLPPPLTAHEHYPNYGICEPAIGRRLTNLSGDSPGLCDKAKQNKQATP